MQPNLEKITIIDNEEKIINLLNDLVFTPRIKALEWSEVTKQTPSLKIGYPGQHLASLIMGMEGERTAARGNDICDGTEIKSCNRVDQLDTCKDCDGKVLRLEEICPHCNSTNIDRKKDSKWLFSVKSEEELDVLINQTDRVFFVLFDYPNFSDNDFNTIQVQAFEVWNNSDRCSNFSTIMTNYYNNTYLHHIQNNPTKTPAPYNMWPDLLPFYQCNPIKVFDCIINDVNESPIINILTLVEPSQDRTNLSSIIAPISLFKADELRELHIASEDEVSVMLNTGFTFNDFINSFNINNNSNFKKRINEILGGVNENLREYIPLRVARDPRSIGAQRRGRRN